MSKRKKVIKCIVGLFLIAILIVAGYFAYLFISYNRIEDNKSLDVVEGAGLDTLRAGESYTILTQNIGFGAYTPDYTFFMDGGKESRAASKESVEACIDKAAETAISYSPDFVIFQEVDTHATRSYYVDEVERINGKMDGFDSVFAMNYHSAYLCYPLNEPHGKSDSGIVTYSKAKVESAVRRSLPISTGFSKFFDLDRCYSASRVKVDNGKELVIYNVHLSAYGSSDNLKTRQLEMLFSDMKSEVDKGNYVVCGGDFNCDFTGDSVKKLNGDDAKQFDWTMPMEQELIPEGLKRCIDYSNGKYEQTVRNCDIPYKEGNYVVIVDGFIVSDNIEVEYLENVQTGFSYSDHNPVIMKFVLLDE